MKPNQYRIINILIWSRTEKTIDTIGLPKQIGLKAYCSLKSEVYQAFPNFQQGIFQNVWWEWEQGGAGVYR